MLTLSSPWVSLWSCECQHETTLKLSQNKQQHTLRGHLQKVF